MSRRYFYKYFFKRWRAPGRRSVASSERGVEFKALYIQQERLLDNDVSSQVVASGSVSPLSSNVNNERHVSCDRECCTKIPLRSVDLCQSRSTKWDACKPGIQPLFGIVTYPPRIYCAAFLCLFLSAGRPPRDRATVWHSTHVHTQRCSIKKTHTSAGWA